MRCEEMDYIPPADAETLERIARARDLTREYYFSDYRDGEKRREILSELLGGDRRKCGD